jgi:hypothetical protein
MRLSGVLSSALLILGSVTAVNAQAQTGTVCKDGTTSVASGRGACSGHGGVDKAAMKAARDAAKASEKATKEQEKAAKKAEKEAKKQAKEANKAATQAAKESGAAKKEEVLIKCTDGTVSHAKGRGACSRHGGVAGQVAAAAPPVNERANAPTPRASERAHERAAPNSAVARSGSGGAEDTNPAGAIAQCKDGMYSHARNRRGACGHHGGVAHWMGT